jgi:hypothetical protein
VKKFIGNIIGQSIVWFLLACFILSVGGCTVSCVAGAFK